MMALGRSLKSISSHSLDTLVKLRFVVIVFLIIGLGVLLGVSTASPDPEAAELVVSITVILTVMALVVSNPLNGILLWLFFMPFIDTWVEIPMGAGIPDLSFSRFIAIFLAIFMLAKAAIGKLRFAPLTLMDLLILVVPLGVAISAPLADDPMLVIQSTVFELFLMTCLIYFFTKNLVQSQADLHQILGTIALFGFVAGAYAVYEYTTGHILFIPKGGIAGHTVSQLITERAESGIRLIRGLMGGTGEMGRVLAMTIPITFYIFFESAQSFRAKIGVAVMLAAQFYGIIVAMSRTPWYALLTALFIMQFFYPQFRRLFVAILVMAAIVIGLTWDQLQDSQVASRVNDNYSTLEGRQIRWDAGYAMWLAKPVRGWGFNGFERYSGQFRTDGKKTNFGNGAIESDYLNMLVSYGLIGFLPYVAFLLIPLIYSLFLFFRARSPGWLGFIKPQTIAVYWAVLLCLVITSYTATIVHPLLKLIPFAVTGAIIGSHEALVRRDRRFQE